MARIQRYCFEGGRELRSKHHNLPTARLSMRGYVSTRKSSSNVFSENAQHAPQRFRGAPEQLITHSKGSQEFRPELELVETADRYVQCPRNGCRREAAHGRFLVVWY